MTNKCEELIKEINDNYREINQITFNKKDNLKINFKFRDHLFELSKKFRNNSVIYDLKMNLKKGPLVLSSFDHDLSHLVPELMAIESHLISHYL